MYSSLMYVQQWIRVDFSTTCAVEQTTVPSTSSSNSKNIGVSAFPSICSGVLFPPLQEHWSTVLSATCVAAEHSARPSLAPSIQKTLKCPLSTAALVAEKRALLHCCTCSREECYSPTHVQQWIIVDFSATCPVEQTTLVHCMCSTGAVHSAMLHGQHWKVDTPMFFELKELVKGTVFCGYTCS